MSKEKNKKKSNPFKYSRLAVFVGRTYVRKKVMKNLSVEIDDKIDVRAIKPPYFICPNHVGFWDPFIISTYIPHDFHYVISDFSFRNKLRAWFLTNIGSIPKTKLVSDTKAVRLMMKGIELEHILGVFPEGSRTWDGTSLPVIYQTVKLIKKMKKPVIVPILHGMFQCNPRWGATPRKGKVVVEFKVGLTAEEVQKMSYDEIFNRLVEMLAYDDIEWQREKMLPVKCGNMAEHLEYAVFACPHCQSIGKTHSDKDLFYCEECGYTVRYNEYSFFEQVSEHNLYFDNIRDWNRWQMKEIQKRVVSFKNQEKSEAIISDEHGKISMGYKLDPMKVLGMAKVDLFYDKMVLTFDDGKEMVFDVPKIRGMNVQDGELIEYYYEDTLYQIIYDGYVSGVKWMRTMEFLQKEYGIALDAAL